MISVLTQYRSHCADFPVRGPVVGLFANQEVKLIKGPLFVNAPHQRDQQDQQKQLRQEAIEKSNFCATHRNSRLQSQPQEGNGCFRCADPDDVCRHPKAVLGRIRVEITSGDRYLSLAGEHGADRLPLELNLQGQ